MENQFSDPSAGVRNLLAAVTCGNIVSNFGVAGKRTTHTWLRVQIDPRRLSMDCTRHALESTHLQLAQGTYYECWIKKTTDTGDGT